MSLPSLLLRLLLCVSLVANGIGFSQASTRMKFTHDAHGAAQEVIPVASAACHDDPSASVAGENAVSHAGMGHGPDSGAAGADDVAGGAECCDGSSCQCACPQQASATAAVALTSGPVPALATLQGRGTSLRESPRLPHLIRPPIG